MRIFTLGYGSDAPTFRRVGDMYWLVVSNNMIRIEKSSMKISLRYADAAGLIEVFDNEEIVELYKIIDTL